MIYLIQNNGMYNNYIRAMLMAFYSGVKIVEKIENGYEIDFTFVANFDSESTTLSVHNGLADAEHDDRTDLSADEIISTKIMGDFNNKQIFRNELKKAMYLLMTEKTGRELPWGDLTGVRPTKIAMAKLNDGCTYEESVRNYLDTYLVSKRKAELATKVAINEMRLVETIDLHNDYCLYFGIPFCPSRCLYCSFTSYPIAVYKDKAKQYVERLKEELSYISEIYKDRNPVAIYMGGGTPTSIDAELLDDLLTHVNKVFNIHKGVEARGSLVTESATEGNSGVADEDGQLCEFTVEAGRPDSITREKLMVMKKHGVTRISINPQTMNDETLRTIGRAHTSARTKEAFALARECGFDNINMDIIAGLPGERLESMKHTLDEIKALNPESITVHSLAIKRAANLKQQMSEYGDTINKDMDAMLDMVSDAAADLSMEPYYLYRQKNIGGNLENVGYAKPGRECLYNVLIMEELTDIIAAGAGESTKLVYHSENRVERVENCKSVDDYIDRFDEMLNRKRVGMKDKL